MEDYDEEDIDEDIGSDSDEEVEMIGEDDVDSDEAGLEEDDSEEESEPETTTDKTEPSKASVVSKYVPPHLRKAATTKSEIQIKLQKQLQGQLNRLSESNMESILLEIEKCYGQYPRHGTYNLIHSIVSVYSYLLF